MSNACRIFVHTVGSVAPPNEVPREWEFNKYSAELHLQRGLLGHPWLTSSTDAASFVFVAANLSLWCAVGRAYGARRLLHHIPRRSARAAPHAAEARRCWSSVTRSAGNRCCAGCVTRCPATRLALVLTNRAPLEPKTSLALTIVLSNPATR